MNVAIAIIGKDQASGPIGAVVRSLHSLDQAAATPIRTITSLGGVVQTAVGTFLGTMLTRGVDALGRGMVSAVSGAANLESQLASTAAAAGLSSDEIGRLKQLTLDLGIDPKLKVSATEAAQAIDALVLNGVPMEAVMTGAARGAVLLANATGGTFAGAANIASDVMSLFNIEASEMQGAVDGVTSVVQASKFTIDDYRLAIAQAGGVAAGAGVEFDDFNAAIAAIAPSFASGSDAGTSFKTMLQRLVPTSGPAAEAMAQMGLMTYDATRAMELLTSRGIKPVNGNLGELWGQLADFHAEMTGLTRGTEEQVEEFNKWSESVGLVHSAFYDAEGQLKDMDEVVGILHDSISALSEEDRTSLVSKAFGTDAMRAALGLAEMTEEQFRELQATMAQTDATEAAATRMDNLRGSMEVLGGIVETLKIRVGDEFLPLVKEGVDGLAGVLDANGDDIVGFFSLLRDGVVTAGQAFNGDWESAPGKIHPLHVAVGDLFTQMGDVNRAIDAFTFLIDNDIPADSALKTVLSTLVPPDTMEKLNPIINGVSHLVSELDKIKERGGTFVFMVSNGVDPKTAAEAAFGPLIEEAKTYVSEHAGEVVGALTQGLATSISGIATSAPNWNENFAALFIEPAQKSGNTFTNWFNDEFKPDAGPGLESLGTALANLDQAIGEELEEGANKVAAAFASHVATELSQTTIDEDGEFDWSHFLFGGTPLEDVEWAPVIQGLSDDLAQALTDATEEDFPLTVWLNKKGPEVEKALTSALNGASTALATWLNAQAETLAGGTVDDFFEVTLPGAISTAKTKFEENAPLMAVAVELSQGRIGTAIGLILPMLDTDLPGSLDTLTSSWGPGWEGVGSTVKNLYDNTLGGVLRSIEGAIEDIRGAWQSLANTVNGTPITPVYNDPNTSSGGSFGGGSGGGRAAGQPAQKPDGERALGGPVIAGLTYLIGERGPEMFVPDVGGRILNASETQASRATASGIPGIVYFGGIHEDGETAGDAFMAGMIQSIRERVAPFADHLREMVITAVQTSGFGDMFGPDDPLRRSLVDGGKGAGYRRGSGMNVGHKGTRWNPDDPYGPSIPPSALWPSGEGVSGYITFEHHIGEAGAASGTAFVDNLAASIRDGQAGLRTTLQHMIGSMVEFITVQTSEELGQFVNGPAVVWPANASGIMPWPYGATPGSRAPGPGEFGYAGPHYDRDEIPGYTPFPQYLEPPRPTYANREAISGYTAFPGEVGGSAEAEADVSEVKALLKEMTALQQKLVNLVERGETQERVIRLVGAGVNQRGLQKGWVAG